MYVKKNIFHNLVINLLFEQNTNIFKSNTASDINQTLSKFNNESFSLFCLLGKTQAKSPGAFNGDYDTN